MKNRCAVRDARGAVSDCLRATLSVAGLILAGCGDRGQPAAPAVASETAAPLLEITGDDEFRGTFAEGEGVRRVVTVRNRGSEAVTLAIPAKSCACVKTELAKDTLAPGESTTLSFEAPASSAVRRRRGDALGRPRLCLTDPLDVDPRGIPAGGVGFNSLYRCGYSFVSPPCHPGAARIFGPGDPSDRA